MSTSSTPARGCAALLGYIYDQPGVLYPMPVGPTYAGPSSEQMTDREHDRHDQKPCEASPEPAPNRLPEPADSGGGSLINVYA